MCLLFYRVSQNYPNMYFSTIISTALKPLKTWIPIFFLKYSSKGKAKCHTPPKSPHDPVQSLFPVSVEDLFFPLCSSTKQAIIDKGRIPRFHNRAIDFIFAGGPANEGRN